VGGAWAGQLVQHWFVILQWIHAIATDPILEREFRAACAILDRLPQPSSVENANARWREFVVALWQTLDRWKQRDRQRRMAQAKTQGTRKSPQKEV
jgi:hypothetical protein